MLQHGFVITSKANISYSRVWTLFPSKVRSVVWEITVFAGRKLFPFEGDGRKKEIKGQRREEDWEENKKRGTYSQQMGPMPMNHERWKEHGVDGAKSQSYWHRHFHMSICNSRKSTFSLPIIHIHVVEHTLRYLVSSCHSFFPLRFIQPSFSYSNALFFYFSHLPLHWHIGHKDAR